MSTDDHDDVKAQTAGPYPGVALILLAGCSGGGGSSSPPPDNPSSVAPVAGYWKGAVTDPFSSNLKSATLFAEASGEFQLHISPLPPNPTGPIFGFGLPFIIYGIACCEASATVSATAKNMDQTLDAPVQLTLDVQPTALTGAFEFEGRRFTFDLARASIDPARLTLNDLAGVYSGSYSSYINTPKGWTLTIQSTGAVTGSDDYGCNWLGTAAVANTAQNMFRLEVEAEGCGAMQLAPSSGTYTGFGVLSRNRANPTRYPGQDVIEFNLVGPIWFGQQMLAR